MDIFQHTPSMIDVEQNRFICAHPSKDEVKKAVWAMNKESAGGPDGFTGMFYQKCWGIIGDDVLNMILAFFDGAYLPNQSHTQILYCCLKS